MIATVLMAIYVAFVRSGGLTWNTPGDTMEMYC